MAASQTRARRLDVTIDGTAMLARSRRAGPRFRSVFRSIFRSMENPMSRVSIKTRDDLPAELRPLWDKMTTYGAFENQAGVMAHRPPIFKHIWSLLVDLADEAAV